MNQLLFIMALVTFAFTLNDRAKKSTVKKPNKKLNDMVNKDLNNRYKSANDVYIGKLHPVAKPIFTNFLNDVIAMGYAVIISSGYRDTAKQVQLKKENSKNATAGFSTHEYGLALDINLVKDGKILNKLSPLADWKKTGVVDLAKNKYKMRWGGDFTGYLDPIHFDLGNTYDTKHLYALAIAKFGSPEKIKGNELNLT